MTETSKRPGTLAEALAALQADLPHVAKAQDAQIQKDGRTVYSYKYADLTDVTDVIMPKMAALGLCFTAAPTMLDGAFVLHYSLLHVSGEDTGGSYPLPTGGSPQELGKAITYARRYALCAVTGLAPGGDDDDAAQAEAGHHKRARASQQTTAQQKAAHRATPPPAAGPERRRAIEHERVAAQTRDTGGVMAPGPIPDAENIWQSPNVPEQAHGSITDGQHRALEMLLTRWGIAREARADRHLAITTVLELEPDTIGSMHDLSAEQAARAIQKIQDEMAKERADV